MSKLATMCIVFCYIVAKISGYVTIFTKIEKILYNT